MKDVLFLLVCNGIIAQE